MKLLRFLKDGGPESRVDGYFLIEWKRMFSIVLLHFHPGSRDAYHSHAFNSYSWLLRGRLREQHMNGEINDYLPSWKSIFTGRRTFHKVTSTGHSWALSFRGPWSKMWYEYIPKEDRLIRLRHGRVEA